MARGWESKAVESQIEAATIRRFPRRDTRSPEELERERKRESLLLQRQRVVHDLENTHSERYRQTLAEGLKWLDQQIEKLAG